MSELHKEPIEVWLVDPIKGFINNSTMSGVVLFLSALLALVLSNSPWAQSFHDFWKTEIMIGIGENVLIKDLRHWINDGLVAIFFFVIGLELKREIIAGELSDPRQAVLPVAAALAGMVFPALIYLLFNQSRPEMDGWGIPMATDIAFALGVLYLLGDRVPVSLKVFITTLAIVDDLGAVLVIAFFYTSDINVMNLVTGGAFLGVLIISNLLGVRSTLYYVLVGIGGLWLSFLSAGVHPTIAAVLVAFTIPANVKVSRTGFGEKVRNLLSQLKQAKQVEARIVSKEQLHLVEDIRKVAKKAITPLQRLEHSLHPFVSFVVMPIFAFCNAGVTFSPQVLTEALNTVTLGVFLGLTAGKALGILLVVFLIVKLGWVRLPYDVSFRHITGAAFLAAIGFTMSLFISGLAFQEEILLEQAKMGILAASLIASCVGYFLIRTAQKRRPSQDAL